jgi:citrate lyase subunit beta/citryl-CoA lyase
MVSTEISAARSSLCVPADDQRKLQKALVSAADQVVVDFEDAVAVHRKDAARKIASDTLARGHSKNVLIRINGLGTPWWQDDLKTIVSNDIGVSGIVVPKAEVADQLNELTRELEKLESGSGPRLEVHLLIESARGILDVDQLLAHSERATAVILGYADLAVSLQRPLGRPAAPTWLAIQNQLLVAARAHGVRAIDGPWFDFKDDAACAAANAHAAAFGFDGKWVIHPSQISGVNAAFSPDADAVKSARRIVEAFESGSEDAVLAVDGTMVDKPVVEAARLVLARDAMTRRIG